MAKAISNFSVLHPKKTREDGKSVDDLQIGLLTFNKRLAQLVVPSQITTESPTNILGALSKIDGVDNIQQAGIYSVQLVLAATFNLEEVWAEITSLADVVTSGIVIPGTFKK